MKNQVGFLVFVCRAMLVVALLCRAQEQAQHFNLPSHESSEKKWKSTTKKGRKVVILGVCTLTPREKGEKRKFGVGEAKTCFHPLKVRKYPQKMECKANTNRFI